MNPRVTWSHQTQCQDLCPLATTASRWVQPGTTRRLRHRHHAIITETTRKTKLPQRPKALQLQAVSQGFNSPCDFTRPRLCDNAQSCSGTTGLLRCAMPAHTQTVGRALAKSPRQGLIRHGPAPSVRRQPRLPGGFDPERRGTSDTRTNLSSLRPATHSYAVERQSPAGQG